MLAAAELDTLCPPGRCYLMTLPAGCRGDAAACSQALPLCNPAASTCGNPVDLVGRSRLLAEGAVLVAELEGARITEARGGLHLHSGNRAYVSAEPGRTLKAGEVLKLALGQSLTLEASPTIDPRTPGRPGGAQPWTYTFGLPPATAPAGLEVTMIVTGPSLRDALRPERTMRAPPDWSIDALRQSSWRSYGEAGRLPADSVPRATDGESHEARLQRMLREREAAERAYRMFRLERQQR